MAEEKLNRRSRAVLDQWEREDQIRRRSDEFFEQRDEEDEQGRRLNRTGGAP